VVELKRRQNGLTALLHQFCKPPSVQGLTLMYRAATPKVKQNRRHPPIINMTITNSSTTIHHHQSRRREHPVSRTRLTISRKSSTCNEGCPEARDVNPLLPSKAKPRPQVRQDFDQCSQHWKFRQAVEAQAVVDTLQLEHEEQRLFGGDIDDDGSLCLAMLDVVIPSTQSLGNLCAIFGCGFPASRS
jgi:hypothetical protein